MLTHAGRGIVGTVCCGPNHTHGRCADSWTACLRAPSSLTCTLPAFPDCAPLPRLPCLISALEVPYISASWALNRIVSCDYPYMWLKVRAGERGKGVEDQAALLATHLVLCGCPYLQEVRLGFRKGTIYKAGSKKGSQGALDASCKARFSVAVISCCSLPML